MASHGVIPYRGNGEVFSDQDVDAVNSRIRDAGHRLDALAVQIMEAPGFPR